MHVRTLVYTSLAACVLAVAINVFHLRWTRGYICGHPSTAITQIAAFKAALNTFQVDTGHYPSGKDAMLQLFQQPPGETNWHGPYLDSDKMPKDPWCHDYVYEFPGRHNTNSFDLMSPGPDGQPGTKDDIANWINKN